MNVPLSMPFPAPGFDIHMPTRVPCARLILGKTVDQLGRAMPSFGHHGSLAQETAARHALGLGGTAGSQAKLIQDVLLDHLSRLFVHLPRFVELSPRALPVGWERNPSSLRHQIFGSFGRLPRSRTELKKWLGTGEGLAPLVAAVGARFLPGEAAAPVLTPPTADALFAPIAIENSVAGRHADHPLMRDVEACSGRGPLWRLLGRLVDIDALIDGRLPKPEAISAGRALVAGARGTYAVAARAVSGVITRFEATTPTDHLTAPGGVIETSFATLPADRAHEAPLVLALLDPCVPVKVAPRCTLALAS